MSCAEAAPKEGPAEILGIPGKGKKKYCHAAAQEKEGKRGTDNSVRIRTYEGPGERSPWGRRRKKKEERALLSKARGGKRGQCVTKCGIYVAQGRNVSFPTPTLSGREGEGGSCLSSGEGAEESCILVGPRAFAGPSLGSRKKREGGKRGRRCPSRP